MEIKQRPLNRGILFGLGGALILIAVGVAYINYKMGVAFYVLGVIGLLSVGVSLFSLNRANKPRVSSAGKIRYIIYTLLLFIGLILVNFLSTTFNHRFDLTSSKQHTLSAQTIQQLGALTKEVKLTAFVVGESPKYIEDLFKEYERNALGKVTTEIVDPVARIGYAANFGNVISGSEKKVIVQMGNMRKEVDFTKAPLTEEQLDNAIASVDRKARHVYFLTGHGEYSPFAQGAIGMNIFAKHLLANNIIPQQLMLGTTALIPEDCDLLVIAGAQNDLTEKEIEIIQAWLKNGGDALFLIEHTVITTPDIPLKEDQLDKNPSLNAMLNDWGVKIASDIVVDLASHAGGDVGSPATRHYMPHKALTQGLDYTIYVRPRSISLLGDRRESIKAVPTVLTESEENSWGETDRTLKVKYDEGVDRKGPVPIGYVMMEPKVEGERSDTRLIVFTDADFLADPYIGFYSNAVMGLNAVNWLTDVDYQVLLDKREVKIHRLDLTSRQKRTVTFFLFCVPMVIALLGVIAWINHYKR